MYLYCGRPIEIWQIVCDLSNGPFLLSWNDPYHSAIYLQKTGVGAVREGWTYRNPWQVHAEAVEAG